MYISSAKKEKNYPELYQAYKGAVRYSKNEKLKYADSAIVAAKLSNDNSLIGNAYTAKGIVYYFNYKKNSNFFDWFITLKFKKKPVKSNFIFYFGFIIYFTFVRILCFPHVINYFS